MMADHGELCDAQNSSYCLNGGTCYTIPAMDTLSCVCRDDYKGSRCDQYQLQSKIGEVGEAGLIAAGVIILLLIIAMVALVIYYVRKTMKAKKQSQPGNQQQYWRVKPRV